MGAGIAYVFAQAGDTVCVVEPDDGRAAAMAATINDVAAAGVARGKMSAKGAEGLIASINRVSSIAASPGEPDLAIETVPERVEIKNEVLRGLSAKNPKLVATNTSAISIDRLAGVVADPGAFLGMHFFNPVWSLKLVEIVRGAATSEEAIASARAFAARIGKQSLVVRDVPGFATSRLDLIAALEAMRMVESGVTSAEEIDRAAMLAYRHPIGPLRLSDIVGLDVRLDIARTLEKAHGPRFAPPEILCNMVRLGLLGRKSGEGFYSWKDE